MKGRVKAILEYLATVQEFMNVDGYMTLEFTQSGYHRNFTETQISL